MKPIINIISSVVKLGAAAAGLVGVFRWQFEVMFIEQTSPGLFGGDNYLLLCSTVLLALGFSLETLHNINSSTS